MVDQECKVHMITINAKHTVLHTSVINIKISFMTDQRFNVWLPKI